MTTLREAAQQALEALKDCVKALDALHAPGDSIYTRASDAADRAEIALRAALAQQEQEQEQVKSDEQAIEDAIEAAYWHFDARKKGLNEWAFAPQSERDAFKSEARKLVKGYFPTRSQEAQQTKREMLAVANAFARGRQAALEQEEQEPELMLNGLTKEETAATASVFGLTQQAEPKTNWCGETCERAKLCAICARELAGVQAEPVAWANKDDFGKFDMRVRSNCDHYHTEPLYAAPPAPPQRKPLTEEEMENIMTNLNVELSGTQQRENKP